MAQEITLSVALAYSDSEGTEDSLEVNNLSVSVATKRIVHLKQNVGTVEEALNLGDVSSLGFAVFVNRDETNYVELRTGTGAVKFVKLKAGEACLFRFGSGVTAPYAVADTAAVQLEMFLCST